MDPCISLLRALIAIDSVNPSLVSGARGEGAIGALIAEHMRRIGLDVHVQNVAGDRSNVIGILEGRSPGRSVMFCGHVDTVGVDGMVRPFEPVEKDGRMYGRGSQDMKGGLAAMIDAARIVAERGLESGRVIVATVVDEEYASIGADALVTAWRADAAIVTEPTDLHVGVGHKGFAWLEVETLGRAAHGSRPRDGRDAIMRMGRVLGRLEALDRELQARAPHPIMETGSLHASTISGGRELSSYPDQCLLHLERRTVAGEDGASAREEVQRVLANLSASDPEFQGTVKLNFSRPPYELAASHQLPRGLAAAAAAQAIDARVVGMSFWTDAAVLASAGIPSVLFGPGGAGLHSTEEYVNIAEVIACRETLVRFAMDWC